MKIVVGIPSRGRPLELAAAVLALEKTKSGGNEVGYIVAADEDDYETIHMRYALDKHAPITMLTGPRPLGLGELHNKMAAATPNDAVFLLWSDRVVPISEDWDHQVAVAAMQFPQRVLWLDSRNLLGAGQFILPPAWREAAGDSCPAVYPYWFEDSAVEELDHYVHGFPRMAVNARCSGVRSAKTNRMRDLLFWGGCYAAQQQQRVEHAKEIARKLGVVQGDTAPIIEHFRNRTIEMMARTKTLTENFGAEGPPDASYLAARARAEKLMEDMGVDWRVWEQVDLTVADKPTMAVEVMHDD